MSERTDKYTKRKGPLGTTEYSVPKQDWDLYGLDTALGRALPGSSYFRDTNFNYPDTVGHERIHQGQFLIKNYPKKLDFKSELLGQFFPPGAGEFNYEDPAYNLSEVLNPYWRKEQQNYLNKYLDLLASKNPQGIQPVESVIPKVLMEESLKTHGRPLFSPQINMQERGLIDAIVSAFSRKK